MKSIVGNLLIQQLEHFTCLLMSLCFLAAEEKWIWTNRKSIAKWLCFIYVYIMNIIYLCFILSYCFMIVVSCIMIDCIFLHGYVVINPLPPNFLYSCNITKLLLLTFCYIIYLVMVSMIALCAIINVIFSWAEHVDLVLTKYLFL